MNREEAIRIAQGLIKDFKCESETMVEFCNVVIKALKQQPCEDAISRQAVLNLIEHYNSDGLGALFYGYDEGLKFTKAVNKLPPVNPQEPNTIQEKQAESEKYQKAYDDGYDNGYAQARFDYEKMPWWLGKNCKDCGNEKCKKLGTLPKKYSCALWQAESEE